ncbi:hypothetical protein V7127_23305 [Bacillus sp. JJ1773]|uniref:hypothetical protein n=1 Tax=Bacillus sp. JJ1773 TaxID=3122965 RepID=UPI002FFEDE5A
MLITLLVLSGESRFDPIEYVRHAAPYDANFIILWYQMLHDSDDGTIGKRNIFSCIGDLAPGFVE